MSGLVRTEKKNGYAVLTIQRPEAMNALNAEVLLQLQKALEGLEKEETIRAVVITGEGKAFVAGADIAAMQNMESGAAYEFAELGQTVFSRIHTSHLVTIGAINGFALGGGMELALACDIRFATEKAKFGLPEVSLGLIPGFGGTQRLSRLVGIGRANELIFSGKMISAAEAREMGIVNQLVPETESLLDFCEAYISEVLKKGPLAVQVAKRVIAEGLDLSLGEGLKLERKIFSDLFGKTESKEGMKAFLEKRPAKF